MAKMRRSNSKARDWLELEGGKNIHFFPHTRFSKDVNIDKAGFDGIATLGKQLILFQVKTNKKCYGIEAKRFKRTAKKYGISCIWINVIDKKGVQVQCF